MTGISEQGAEGVAHGSPAERGLDLKAITTLCGNSSCPTVYTSGRGTVVVQGYTVSATHAGIDVPPGEMLVEIPVELLAEAARLVS